MILMFICLCNCLRDSQICRAQESGAGNVGEAFKTLGCQPQCGKCVPFIRDMLRSAQAPEAAAN